MVNPAGAAQAAQAPPPIAVPPIAKFLDLPGEPPIPWRRWILQFENFWTMANAGRPEEALHTPQQKSRYLLLMLGAEGARLTADCPAVDQIDTLPHQTFVDALRSIFEPQRSPVRAIATSTGGTSAKGKQWMSGWRTSGLWRCIASSPMVRRIACWRDNLLQDASRTRPGSDFISWQKSTWNGYGKS